MAGRRLILLHKLESKTYSDYDKAQVELIEDFLTIYDEMEENMEEATEEPDKYDRELEWESNVVAIAKIRMMILDLPYDSNLSQKSLDMLDKVLVNLPK